MTPRVDVLIAARALIADPQNWTQGAYARQTDQFGDYAEVLSPDAKCFCALGALSRAAGINDPLGIDEVPEYRLLQKAVGKLTNGRCHYVPSVNDGYARLPGDLTPHEGVLKLYDMAIEEARRESV